MKTTKKVLSLLLAVIMVMSSMSVCFGVSFTASAAASYEALETLATALKQDVFKSIKWTAGKQGSTGKDGSKPTMVFGKPVGGSASTKVITNPTTATVDKYSDYILVVDAINALDAALKDGTNFDFPSNDGSTQACIDFVTERTRIIAELIDTGLMDNDDISTYQVETFLKRVFCETGAVLHTKSGTHEYNIPAKVFSTVTVTTSDYKGYLAAKDSIDAVEKPISMGIKYTTAMYRKSYKGTGFAANTYYHNAFHNQDCTSLTIDTTVNNNTAVKPQLTAYQTEFNNMNLSQYTTEKLLDMLSADSTSLDTLANTINAWRTKVIGYVGSEATYLRLYAAEEALLQETLTAINAAKNSQVYFELAEKWRDFMTAHPDYGTYNWGGFDEYTIKLDYKNFYYGTYKAIDDPAMYEYLDSKGLIDDEYFINFTDNVKAYDLRDSKAAADAVYEANKDTYADLSYDEQVALKSQLNGYINAISTYSEQVINSIYPDGWQYLIDLRDEVDCEINEYVLWFAEKMSISYVDAETEDIQALIDEIPGQLAGLEAFYNQIKGSSGEAKANELLGELLADARAFRGELYQLLGDRFTAEVLHADEVYTAIGRPTTLDVSLFLQLKAAFDGLEEDLLSYLDDAGQGATVTAETRAIYAALKAAIYDKYVEFQKTYGFSTYEQSQITYEARNDYENDVLKGDFADYVPTEEALLDLIEKLDGFLSSDNFANLTGLEGGLGGMLTELVSGAIYSDEFINTIVNILYPLVLTEFEKVWSTLPQTVTALGQTVAVRYEKSLQQVLDDVNFKIYPNSLATLIDGSKYSEAKTALAAAKNWTSVAIYDYEEEILTLNWGVNEAENKEEAFYDAFAVAMEGLKPLIMALLCGKQWNPSTVGGLATGVIDLGFLGSAGLEVQLTLSATGNDGYLNLLGALFEALGVKDIPTASEISQFTTNEQVARAIFEPIFGFLAQIGEKPIDTILGALPNLLYGLSFNMIPALLGMLKTDIAYKADAVVIGDATYPALEDKANINVGKMLDLEDLLGIDLSKGLSALLGLLGVEIPEIDAATVATAGELKVIDSVRTESIYGLASGKGYHIEADKADLAYYILTYALNLIKDEEAFTNLLGMILTTENDAGETVPDEEAIAGAKEIVYGEMLNFGEMNVGDAVAALVELLADPQVYDNFAQYKWYTADVGGDIDGITPADMVYLTYGNNWTEDTARYVTANLNDIIANVAGLDLGTTISDAIGGLFTADTIAGITEAILPLLESEDVAPTLETIAPILKDFLGIDLEELIADLKAEYTVADSESFVAALSALLDELSPVLEFLLDGKDLTITLNEGNTVVLKGYNGYDTALIPLLEALGVTDLVIPEGTDTLSFVLNAIFARIDALTQGNVISNILDLLPGVFYYLASNALSVGVENLLHGIYAILDVIRPVIDIDLRELIAGLEININEQPVTIDIEHLGIGLITDILNAALGLNFASLQDIIYDVCRIIGTEHTYVGYAGEGKIGAYSADFEQHDMVTVIISYVLDWLKTDDNAADLEKLLKDSGVEIEDGLLNAVIAIFGDTPVDTKAINYGYFAGDADLTEQYYPQGITVYQTSLGYPTDWTEETAEYIDANLTVIVDEIIALINSGKEDAPKTLAEITSGLTGSIYTKENVEAIRDAVAGLLESIDTSLLDAVGVLLGADITAFAGYEVGEVTDGASFAKELAGLLGTIDGLLNWLLFGADYRFFHSDPTAADAIVINGGNGYAKGLVPILEALGIALPENANIDSVEAVLAAVFARLDGILADPIEEILDLLPNVIYFINADGVSACVYNLLAPVNALLESLKPLGLEVDLYGMVKDAIGLDLANVNFDTLLALVTDLTKGDEEGAEGLNLDVLAELLDGLVFGTVEKFTTTVGDDAFRMVCDEEMQRHDLLTLVVTIALITLETEGNAEKLDNMIGTDGIVVTITELIKGIDVEYVTPDWDYCWAEDGIDYNNNTVDVMKYAITYPNNWTEETAKYVADNLGNIGDLIASLIDSNYTSLGGLINDKVTIYTGENINAIVGAISDLLGGIDETLIEAAGKLLGADIAGLKAYKAPEGEMTKDAFVDELSKVLTTYAGNLLDWLLYGRNYQFLVDETIVGEEFEDGEAIITINGAHGYAEGLALLLEALACEDLPEVYGVADFDSAAATKAILNSLFTRVDAILADPVTEVFAILPNILYFLNANGVAAVVDNLTAGLMALIGALEPLGIELNLNELINIPELLGLEGEYKISIDNLTMEAVIELVAALTGFNLDKIDDVLTGFALGEVKEYGSVSRTNATYRMYYNDEFAVYDMVTVLANVILISIDDEANKAKLSEMLGEDVYNVIINFFGIGEVPVQEFNWQFTDKADTDFVFSAIQTSELYKGHKYGPHYTKEMEQYIADNIGEFIDNVIYLLGIQIDGKNIDSLTELINGLVGGSVYSSEVADSLVEALKGVVDSLEGLGNGAGKHIIAILKTSLGVDLTAYDSMVFEAFDNDRAKFEAALGTIVEPLFPLLKWLLANEDISFFTDEDKTHLITLPGAEGYAYGIIPLLEVLDCENIVTSAAYYDAVAADDSVLITSILKPLLDRVDVILNNPAEEILAMLPNLIYFINSNGVDTVVKNTLNAVYAIFNAIEPIAKIDLYELIGLDLSTLTFEKLFDMLLDMIADSTGYEFEAMDASAVAELSVGKLVSYTSANGKTAYKMIYQSAEAKGEMVTVVMRLLITFIMHENNQEMLLGLLRDYLGMTAEAEKYVAGVLKVIADCSTETQLGMDNALATLYYIYYGLDIGVGETADGKKDLDAEWTKLLEEMRNSKDDGEALAGEIITGILDLDIFEDIIDPVEGIAPNGFIKFFQKIAEWFQAIIDFFKNLFN